MIISVGFSHGDLSRFRPENTLINTTWHKSATTPLINVSYLRLTGRKVATRKPAKWWLFRVFAWRPFAPPHESTRLSIRCVYGYCLSYLCLGEGGRKVAMRKPDKITIWRVFAWRLFVFSPRKHAYTTWHKAVTIEELIVLEVQNMYIILISEFQL